MHKRQGGLAPSVSSPCTCQLDHDCPAAGTFAETQQGVGRRHYRGIAHVLAFPSSLASSVPALTARTRMPCFHSIAHARYTRLLDSSTLPNRVGSALSAASRLRFRRCFAKSTGRYVPACHDPAQHQLVQGQASRPRRHLQASAFVSKALKSAKETSSRIPLRTPAKQLPEISQTPKYSKGPRTPGRAS